MNLANRIRAVGEPTGKKKSLPIRVVCCQGCGKKIQSDGDLKDVEYVKTKRGSEWFFHRGCMDKVWKTKIR